MNHGGETAQNVLKVFALLQHYPDLALILHVNPIFCCPGLVSDSVFKAVENDIGIPIVFDSSTDGTAAKKNEALAPYLHYILQRTQLNFQVNDDQSASGGNNAIRSRRPGSFAQPRALHCHAQPAQPVSWLAALTLWCSGPVLLS